MNYINIRLKNIHTYMLKANYVKLFNLAVVVDVIGLYNFKC